MASLKKSEWVFLFPLVILIVTFVVIAKSSSFRSLSSENQKKDSLVSVEVDGCVYRPGVYEVPEGSLLGGVVRKARPKPLADLGEIDLMQIVERSCKIEVPMHKEICIDVRGCVEQEVRLVLPAGSRVCDLKKLVVLSEGADQACLRSRKILRNLDVLVIPSQKKSQP